MGLLGGLFNKHTDENVGNDTLSFDRADIPVLGANVQQVGGLQGFLQGQMGQGDFYSQAAQQGLGAFGQGLQGDQAAAGGQQSLAQMLLAQAQGQGPSLAQQQLQQGLQQNQAQAAGAIASQRGINPALAARLVNNAQTQAGQQAAGQAAMLRSQEQLNAQGQLGNVLAQQRQGAQGMAGLGQGLFGAGGQLQQSNLGQYANLFQGQNQNELARNAQLAQQYQAIANNQNVYNQMRLQQAEGNASRKAQIATGNTQGDNAAGGQIMGAVGSMFALAHGGAVPDVGNPSPVANHVSFAELVAHHLTAHSQLPQAMAKGGKVKPSISLTPADMSSQDKEQKALGMGLLSAEEPVTGGKETPQKMADGGAAEPGGFAGYMQKLGEKFASIPGKLADNFQNGAIGQMFHPGLMQNTQGGVTTTIGDSNAMGAGGLLPSATAPVPMQTSLMGRAPMMQAGGGRVPGVAAHPDEDTEKDDTVPALLSPGEVVLPKTIANNPSKAAAFVQKLINEGEIHPAIVNWRHGKRNK